MQALLESLDLLCDPVSVLSGSLRRVGGRSGARNLLDASRQVIESELGSGKIVSAIVAPGVDRRIRFEVLSCCLLQDDGVEPFVQRQPSTPSRCLRGLAGLVPDTFDAPRKPKSHCSHPHPRWSR